MAKPSARRVKVIKAVTYHPAGSLAWYRHFPEGFEGTVTEQQFAYLKAQGALAEPAKLAPDADAASSAGAAE